MFLVEANCLHIPTQTSRETMRLHIFKTNQDRLQITSVLSYVFNSEQKLTRPAPAQKPLRPQTTSAMDMENIDSSTTWYLGYFVCHCSDSQVHAFKKDHHRNKVFSVVIIKTICKVCSKPHSAFFLCIVALKAVCKRCACLLWLSPHRATVCKLNSLQTNS